MPLRACKRTKLRDCAIINWRGEVGKPEGAYGKMTTKERERERERERGRGGGLDVKFYTFGGGETLLFHSLS